MDEFFVNVVAVFFSLILGFGWFLVFFIPALILLALITVPPVFIATEGIKQVTKTVFARKVKRSSVQILVADDDEISVAPLMAALSCEGEFEITFAKDGKEAASYLKKNSYRLVFIDYFMPIKRGDTALVESDSRPQIEFNGFAKTPVVFYTNYESAQSGLKQLTLNSYEVCDVWSKQTSLLQLSNKLHELVSNLNQQRAELTLS